MGPSSTRASAAAAALRRLREGVVLDDGPTAPARVSLVQAGDGTSALEVVVHEGRNRQVRRMVEALGAKVLKLVRTKIGNIEIGSLEIGKHRELTLEEVKGLVI